MSPTPGDAIPARADPPYAADLIALTKPRLTLLVIATTGGGLWLALTRTR